jgi:bacteriochlorophyll 4-vinyl reductase
MGETAPRRIQNSIMSLALSSAETTLNKSGYYAVLQIAGLDHYAETLPPNDHNLETPAEDFTALFAGMLKMYGEIPARGLFRRWGAAFSTSALKRRPTATLLKPLLSVLPLQRRIRTVLDAIVGESDQARGAALHTLEDFPDHYTLTFHDCLYCVGLHPAEPICYTIVGTLEAALTWGLGRDFSVREVQCHARGAAACVFEIGKQPLHV